MLVKIEEHLLKGVKPNIDIKDPNIWIAGGAVRRWFSGEKQDSDIDILSSKKEYLDKFVMDMQLGRPKFSTKTADTYIVDKTAIQIIKLYSNSPEESLDGFDFKHCQFFYTTEGVYATHEAIICTLRKHLAVHRIRRGFEMDSLRRAFKYHSQGYNPCYGTLRDLAFAIMQMDQSSMMQQIEISPSGGTRVVRFD